MQSILEMSASDLGREIDAGMLDPVEIIEAYLEATTAHPEAKRIYTIMTPKRALAEAEMASQRARSGERLSVLDGVPISWKDLFDTAGDVTEAGSDLLAGRIPEKDALCLRNATAVGLVCLGKTHMSELAFSGIGLNPVKETPPCINFPDTVPGGSSSGAGASVAFGLSPAAIGSDTGGSVRIPAAWNDLVGLKTTSGLISLEGVVPLCASFDTVGPLTKTVEDAAHIFTALAGQRAMDLANASLSGRRLAILKGDLFDVTRNAPAQAFQESVEKFAKAGAEIREVTLDFLSDANTMGGPLFVGEAYGTWKHVIEAAPEKMFAPICDRFRQGKDVSAADFVAGWQQLERYRAEFKSLTNGFDAVICPTAPIMPPKIDRLLSDDQYYVTENLFSLRYTRIANLMGTCAVTLPTGYPSCGVMLAAGAFEERRLLRLAMGAELALTR